ncbi:hypothetical protein ACHAXT_000186 [Thalassiosira profunda]
MVQRLVRLAIAAAIWLVWIDLPREHYAPSNNTFASWNELQEGLCPRMTPNPRAWPTIFELARAELGLSNVTIADRAEIDAFSLFFAFTAGARVYATTPAGAGQPRRVMISLSMYKCASNHVMANLDDWSKREEGVDFGGSFDTLDRLYGADTSPLRDVFQANNTCVVTAVRNPVGRFLSAYNEVMYRRRTRHGTRPQQLAMSANIPEGTPAHFEQFFTEFLRQPQSSYGSRMEALEMTHLYSTTGSLRALDRARRCHGNDRVPRPNDVAYVLANAQMNLDFPDMMQRHCEMPALPVFSIEKEYHDSQKDPFKYHSAAKTVWKTGGRVSRALCIIHVMDYSCWQNIDVPEFCRAVFEEDSFREKLTDAAMNGRSWGDEEDCTARDFPWM